MRRFLIIPAVFGGALFVALGVLSKGWLEPDGLPIFDARVFGYDLDDASRYLDQLSDEGRRLYLGLFRVLDTLLPLALFVTLAGGLWRNTAGFRPPLRAVMLVLPALYLVADLLENAQVAALLRAEAGVDARMVRVASTCTQMKWLSLALCLVMVLGCWLAARGKREQTA